MLNIGIRKHKLLVYIHTTLKKGPQNFREYCNTTISEHSQHIVQRPCRRHFDLRPGFLPASLESVERELPSDVEMSRKTSQFDGRGGHCLLLASPVSK